jgi:hypothetical protein
MRSILWRQPVALTGAAVALALALCGCTDEGSRNVASTSPPAEPVFANEDEALEAAQLVFEEYLKATDDIIAQGGESPDGVDQFVTSELAETEKTGFRDFKNRGWHSAGSSVLDGVGLQSYRPNAKDGAEVLRFYACVDVSGVDVIDLDGKSVVSTDRPDRSAFEVAFNIDLSVPQRLRVSSSAPWEGPGLC